jgi:hypothetical protein
LRNDETGFGRRRADQIRLADGLKWYQRERGENGNCLINGYSAMVSLYKKYSKKLKKVLGIITLPILLEGRLKSATPLIKTDITHLK